VTPDLAWLRDEARVYPVTIDPSFQLAGATDTYVQNGITAGQGASATLKTGGTSAADAARPLLWFDVSPLAGKHVLSAALTLWQSWAPTCVPTQVSAFRVTAPWASSVVWPGPTIDGAPLSSVTAAKGAAGCPAGSLTLDVTAAVQNWLSLSWPNYGLQLRAPTETSGGSRKHFDSAEAANDPYLAVTYNSRPAPPAGVQPADGTSSVNLTPTLSATFSDPDPGATGSVEFEIHKQSSGALVAAGTGSSVQVGSSSTWSVPPGSLASGAVYVWRARANDGTDVSSWSDSVTYATGGGTPTSSSPPVVSGQLKVGETLTAASGSWSGTAPLGYSYQWRRCSYRAAVLADQPLGYWRLGERNGTAAGNQVAPDGGTYFGGVTLGAAGALPGDPDTSAGFDGVDDRVVVPHSRQLDVGDTFTLEAWLKPAQTSGERRLFEKGQGQTPGAYALELTGGGYVALNESGVAEIARTTIPLGPGSWHHVVATKADSLVKIYVDGVDRTGTVSNRTLADTSAPLRFGEYQGGGMYLSGSLDELAVYPTALPLERVHAHQSSAANPVCVDVAGATGQGYPLTAADLGARMIVRVTATNLLGSVTVASAPTAPVGDDTPSAPSLESPLDSVNVPTAQPVLKATATDPERRSLSYRFQVAVDAAFANVVDDSGFLPGTNTYAVAPGALAQGATYFWRAAASDGSSLSAWSKARRFTVRLEFLGARDYLAMWTLGPLSVNQATGNALLALPGPSYATAAGSMGVSLVWNSLATADKGLGRGWTLTGLSFGNPERLVDHSVLAGAARLEAAELVFPDGSSEFYSRVASSSTYLSPAGETSRLTRNEDASWTYVAADGAIFTFGPADGTTGIARMTAAERSAAGPGNGKVIYDFSSGSAPRLISLQDTAKRTLSFLWSSLAPADCPDAILCVKGPDNVVWKYIGDGPAGTSGSVARVNDGTRDLVRLTYANGLVAAIQNANDLDSGHASPGYDGRHAIALRYDGQRRLTELAEGPIGGQTPSVSTWTIGYVPGPVSTTPIAADHPGAPLGTVRQAAGYSTLEPPRSRGTGNAVKTFWDELGHPLETVDLLGHVTRSSYNGRDLLEWTEDETGAPVDFVHDPVTDVLLSVTGPDPDGPGPLGRPVTTNRYDEKAIGTAEQAGIPLRGLRADYFSNRNLAGRPARTQTDAAVDFAWGSGAPSGTGLPAENFSVRWSGVVDVTSRGDYVFEATADNHVRVILDGMLIANKWTGFLESTTASAPIPLEAGTHTLAVEYVEETGSASVQVRWACPTCVPAIPEQVIPTASLRPVYLNRTSTVSPAGRVGFSHRAEPWTTLVDYSLVRLADGTSVITSYSYDGTGRITQKVTPKGNASRTIDAGGKLTGSPNGTFAVNWAYWGLTQAAAPPSACAGPSVSQAGLLRQRSEAGATARVTYHDAAGRVIAITGGEGTSCTAYDTEGRITSTKAPTAYGGTTYETTTYAYDPAGALRTATTGAEAVSTEYDEAGRARKIRDSFGAEAAFAHDAEGNMTQRLAAPGPLSLTPAYMTSYGYDAAGQMTTLIDPSARSYRFTYDPRGLLRTTQYPNGTFSWADYDAAGWLIGRYNRHGLLPSPLSGSVPADAGPIADYRYSYDSEGRITSETRSGGGLVAETTTYSQYDALGRLAEVLLPDGTCRRYAFDLNSNRTEIREGPSCTALSAVETYVYSGSHLDRLVSVARAGSSRALTYRSGGEVATRGADTIAWDGRGRHTGGTFAGTDVAYAFDPVGFRRQRQSGALTTRYLLDGLLEAAPSGSVTSFDVDGPEGDVARYAGPPVPASSVRYVYYDGAGDVAAEADGAGARTAAYAYDAFGAVRETLPVNAAVERWAGAKDRKVDGASGLIDMGARPYDPALGRFLAVDPVEGGSLSLYDYAAQDPVNASDLDGSLLTLEGGAGVFVPPRVITTPAPAPPPAPAPVPAPIPGPTISTPLGGSSVSASGASTPRPCAVPLRVCEAPGPRPECTPGESRAFPEVLWVCDENGRWIVIPLNPGGNGVAPPPWSARPAGPVPPRKKSRQCPYAKRPDLCLKA
jgi:RHS repeat-associated protein